MQRFGRATVWYTVVGLVGPAVALLLTPVYTRAIGVAGYGTVDIVQSFWQGVYTVAFWGMGTVLAGVYTRHDDERWRGTVLTSVLAVVGACATVVALGMTVGGAAIAQLLARPAVAPVLPLLAAALPCAVVNAALQAVFRIRMDIRRSVVATLGLVVITATTRLGLVVWGDQGVLGMVRAIALTNVLMAVLCLALGWRLLTPRIDGALVREVVWAGLPLLPVSITGWVLLYADRWLLAPQVSPVALGQYALAVLVASLAAFAFEPLKNVWLPVALRTHAPGFVALSGQLALVVCVLVVSAVLLVTPLLLWLVGGHDAPGAAGMVLPLLSMPVAGVLQTVLSIRAVKTVRTAVFGMSSVTAALVNIGVNLVLIPRYGVMGAAWATAIAAAAGTVVIAVRERAILRELLTGPVAMATAVWALMLVWWWWSGALLGAAGVGAAVAVVLWTGWQCWPLWRSAIDPQRDDAGVTGEIS